MIGGARSKRYPNARSKPSVTLSAMRFLVPSTVAIALMTGPANATGPKQHSVTGARAAQTLCLDSQVISHNTDYPSDIRLEYPRVCKSGELLMLDGAPHAVAIWCDLSKPVIQLGQTTLCTMLPIPR